MLQVKSKILACQSNRWLGRLNRLSLLATSRIPKSRGHFGLKQAAPSLPREIELCIF